MKSPPIDMFYVDRFMRKLPLIFLTPDDIPDEAPFKLVCARLNLEVEECKFLVVEYRKAGGGGGKLMGEALDRVIARHSLEPGTEADYRRYMDIGREEFIRTALRLRNESFSVSTVVNVVPIF